MDELAKRFAELAEKYGPSVADAAKAAARTGAYSTLAGGIMAISMGVMLLLTSRWIWRKAGNADFIVYFSAVVVAMIGAITFCIGLWAWINPWTWTTIAHPELWIAKQVFRL